MWVYWKGCSFSREFLHVFWMNSHLGRLVKPLNLLCRILFLMHKVKYIEICYWICFFLNMWHGNECIPLLTYYIIWSRGRRSSSNNIEILRSVNGIVKHPQQCHVVKKNQRFLLVMNSLVSLISVWFVVTFITATFIVQHYWKHYTSIK